MKSVSMKAVLFLVFLFVFTHILFAQGVKTVSFKEFSFDYPADWRLIDKSTENSQQFNLMPQNGNVLIMLISFPNRVSTYDDFNRIRTESTQSIADRIYSRFNKTGNARKESVCTIIGNNDIPGDRIMGAYNEDPSTADMFHFAMNEKFFSLIYLRDDKESSKSDSVWNNIIKSFNVKDFKTDKFNLIIDIGNDEVLNWRATKLVRPLFPFKNKGSGSVKVRIVIDEKGKVISAKGISGAWVYFSYAENAAEDSKFEPALICGKPGKISGVLTYTFGDR